MSRDIPAATRQTLEQSQSPDAILAFLTVTHPNLDTPIRVVSDVFGYIWGGETYVGIPFDARPVTDTDEPPYTELRIQNVDRRIGQALIDARDRARVALSLLSSADFDLTVVPRTEIGTAAEIYAFSQFELVDVRANTLEIVGRAVLRDFSTEPWPGIAGTQDRLPGLYR